MSDIDPAEFGRLAAKVEVMEDQIAEMRTDMKQLLELANRGRGAFWAMMALSSFVGAVVTKLGTWLNVIPK